MRGGILLIFAPRLGDKSNWSMTLGELYNTITQYLSFFIHIIAVAVRSEEEVLWRRGPPLTYFCPALDPPLGGSGWKPTTLVGDREYFIPSIKIHKAVLESNGRTTKDGRMARYDNSSLHPYKVSSKSIKRFWRWTDGRTDGALWQ